MLEPLLILITLVLMCLSLGLILIPAVPVSALEWALAMVFTALNVLFGYERVTPLAALVMTALMVIGSSSQFWMPFLGLKGRGLSCLGLFAFFVGMMLGTALIPIPFIGTIAGGMIAVFVVEYAQIQELRQAMKSGAMALKLVIYGMIAELVFAVLIIITFGVSILATG